MVESAHFTASCKAAHELVAARATDAKAPTRAGKELHSVGPPPFSAFQADNVLVLGQLDFHDRGFAGRYALRCHCFAFDLFPCGKVPVEELEVIEVITAPHCRDRHGVR